jgi:hypothetical protein
MNAIIRFDTTITSRAGDMTDEQWAKLKPFVERLKAAESAANEYKMKTLRIGGLVSDREQVFIDSRIAWFKGEVDEARAALVSERIDFLGS